MSSMFLLSSSSTPFHKQHELDCRTLRYSHLQRNTLLRHLPSSLLWLSVSSLPFRDFFFLAGSIKSSSSCVSDGSVSIFSSFWKFAIYLVKDDAWQWLSVGVWWCWTDQTSNAKRIWCVGSDINLFFKGIQGHWRITLSRSNHLSTKSHYGHENNSKFNNYTCANNRLTFIPSSRSASKILSFLDFFFFFFWLKKFKSSRSSDVSGTSK